MEKSTPPFPWFFQLKISCCICALLSYQYTVIVAGVDMLSFEQEFEITWGFDHVSTSDDGQTIWLMLDNSSGSSFASKSLYLYGSISMQMKLVPGDSAGVVIAYYVLSIFLQMASSNPDSRDEVDFEFLGNTSGQPYILQTNVFSQGVGGREQRIYLWFDPSEDFHVYSFLWNEKHVVFMVDDIPIREFKNMEKQGMSYLNKQAMGIFSSIWNGDQWATEGGLLKTNWTHAPFITAYKGFHVEACEYATPTITSRSSHGNCRSSRSWWNRSPFTRLSSYHLSMLRWVKENYLVYDYCKDLQRYPLSPFECQFNP